jgi:hypothetical protein
MLIMYLPAPAPAEAPSFVLAVARVASDGEAAAAEAGAAAAAPAPAPTAGDGEIDGESAGDEESCEGERAEWCDAAVSFSSSTTSTCGLLVLFCCFLLARMAAANVPLNGADEPYVKSLLSCWI